MTVQAHIVTSVDAIPDAPGCWSVTCKLPPEEDSPDVGRQHEYRFHHEALHWRAAEYGIDPADSATLLDVVLCEPHMHGHGAQAPDFVYSTDEAAARAGHLARVRQIRAEHVAIEDPQGLLGAIHREHHVDAAAHAGRRATVAAHRAGFHLPHHSMTSPGGSHG